MGIYKKYDKTIKWATFRTVVGRNKYITQLYKAETEKIKRRLDRYEEKRALAEQKTKDAEAEKTKRKTKKKQTYTVHFRVLTTVAKKTQLMDESLNLKRKQNKSARSITINGVKYMQVGKEYTFETKNKWFLNNFKTQGTKQDYIVRAQRGEPGSRWRKTVRYVMEALEELNANHIISYMDAIYIPKVTLNIDPSEAVDVKTEEKKDDSEIDGLYNNYLYHVLNNGGNQYADHPYLSKHFKPRSCMLTAIIETYYEPFQMKKSDGKRAFKENITYEYLCDLFNLECTDDNIACTIQTAKIFFEKFSIGMKVFDKYNNIIEEYTPNKYSRIRPITMYLQTYNSHVFVLKDKLKVLQQKAEHIGYGKIDPASISKRYRIINDFDKTYEICFTWKDIKDVVTSYEPLAPDDKSEDDDDDDDNDTETKIREHYINVQYCGNLNQLAYQIVFEEKYTPYISLDGSMVSSLALKIKHNDVNINLGITSLDKSEMIDSDSFLCPDSFADDEEEKEWLIKSAIEYNKAYANCYKWLINKSHMSTYDARTHETEKDTMIRPICCTFQDCEYDNNEMVALDINKAYTSNLMDMDRFPCFNAFDRYQDYDNHTIEDYTMYYIRSTRNDNSTAVLFGARYSRAYGYKLNRIDRTLFEILSFKRPSNLIDTNSKSKIKRLYDNDMLSSTSKKQIINVLLGLMEKKVNKKSTCNMFMTAEEAQYYVNEFGGKVSELTCYKDIPADDDDDVHGWVINFDELKHKIYTAVQSKDKELADGFLPIKEMIYDIQRLKLYNMYQECIKNGIEPHGIKTDCIMVHRSDRFKLWSVFKNRIDKKKP